MKIPASLVSKTIQDFVLAARDAQCALAKAGVQIQYGDEIVLEMEVVPDGGFNAIQRTTEDRAGSSTKREVRPATVSTTVESEQITKSVETAGPATRRETRNSAASTRTEVTQAHVKASQSTQGGSVTTTESTHTVESTSGQDNRGGDIVTQDYETEST